MDKFMLRVTWKGTGLRAVMITLKKPWKKKEKPFYPNVKDYYTTTETRQYGGQRWWHTTITPTTGEPEGGECQVQAQLLQLSKTLLQNKK